MFTNLWWLFSVLFSIDGCTIYWLIFWGWNGIFMSFPFSFMYQISMWLSWSVGFKFLTPDLLSTERDQKEIEMQTSQYLKALKLRWIYTGVCVCVKPKGSTQPLVASVVRHLTSCVPAGTQFKSPWVRCTNLHQCKNLISLILDCKNAHHFSQSNDLSVYKIIWILKKPPACTTIILEGLKMRQEQQVLMTVFEHSGKFQWTNAVHSQYSSNS